MASATAYDAVKAAVVAAAGVVPVIDYDQIEPALQQSAAAFVALSDEGGSERLASLGSPTSARIREEGIVTVHIYLPRANASAAARTLADSLRNALRHRALTVADGEVRITDCLPAYPAMSNDGLWSETEFDVAFTYDFLRSVA